MSIKRIRYVEDANGNWVTQDYLRTEEGREFRAGFVGGDPKTPTQGFIKSVDNDTTHLTLQATSHWKIKIKIKRALEKLGCKFEKEGRKPRKSTTDTVGS